MTYREIINAVLLRLRETTIATDWSGNINDSNVVTDYQKLIGALVNDTKTYVENTHNWNTLRETYTITLEEDTMRYALGNASSGVGNSFNIIDVINQNTGRHLNQVNTVWLNARMFPTTEVRKDEPTYYAINGSEQVDTSREPDAVIEFYPVPSANYAGQEVNVNVCKNQETLKKSTTILQVPSLPIILGAWSRAIAERGEDGGTQSSLAAQESVVALNQAISIDTGNLEYEKDFFVSTRYNLENNG